MAAPLGEPPAEVLIFESRGPSDEQGGSGQGIGEVLFSGHTFRVVERTQVTRVGAYLQSSSPLSVFAALYRVEMPGAAADVAGDAGLLAVALLEVPGDGVAQEVSAPLSAILEPGWYAYVLGTGRHGASAGNFSVSLRSLPTAMTPQSYGQYQLNATNNQLLNTSITGRFTVFGHVLPPLPVPDTVFRMETARPYAWWLTPDGSSTGGTSISNTQFAGTRFEVAKTARVDRVGMWGFGGTGTLFAAILRLPNGDALPPQVNSQAFQDSLVASTLIQLPGARDAYYGDFDDVELTPGHYALIFGSGILGASGNTAMLWIDEDSMVLPGSLFWQNGSSWRLDPDDFWMLLTGIVPELAADPDPLDFGEVPVGATVERSVVIDNLRDEGSLLVTSLQLSGDDADRFALAETGECLDAPVADTCSFSVVYSPDAVGAQSALLEVHSDGVPSPYRVELGGIGIPSAVVTPSSAGNGSIDPATPQIVAIDDTAGFVLAPDAGYDIGPVGGTCGGGLDGADYVTAPVAEDCTVIAGFTEQTAIALSTDASLARVGQPVPFTATVSGSQSAPADGQVQITATSGESCIVAGPSAAEGATASFTCEIAFGNLGPRGLTADFSASATHSPGASSPPLDFPVVRLADLSIAIDDGQIVVEPDETVEYLIEVRNAGPDPAPGTAISVAVDPSLLDAGWTCIEQGGADCPAADGFGEIAVETDLPVGGGLDFVLTGELPATLPATVLALAQVAADPEAPNFVVDPVLADNQDSDLNRSSRIFADGFEQGADGS